MNKRTKLTLVIGAVAAVVSAIVLIIVFWDKLLNKCRKDTWEDEFLPEDEPEEEAVTYPAEELADFADLNTPEAE